MTINRISRSVLVTAIALSLGACVPMTLPTYGANSSYGASGPAQVTHTVQVEVEGWKKNPLQGATVTFDATANSSDHLPVQTCTTGADGQCSVSIQVPRDPSLTYVNSYMSTTHVTAKLNGYYSASTSVFDSSGSGISSTSPGVKTLVLIKPSDYLSPSFAETNGDSKFRDRILNFISILKLQSILVDTTLRPESIDIDQYKRRKYLHFAFDSDNTYNTLKMNRYQIGQRVFDGAIRKLLNPLNAIALPRSLHGYDVVVATSMKSFLDKYATPSPLKYRFIMPESAVRSYKHQSITGQQLLNKSIILLNNERISLKLQ